MTMWTALTTLNQSPRTCVVPKALGLGISGYVCRYLRQMSFSGSIVVFSCTPELRAAALIINALLDFALCHARNY